MSDPIDGEGPPQVKSDPSLLLPDAAQMTPDSDAEGEPIVSNGVALCKVPHAAFDRLFFAIRPDYVIEVRPSVLLESDGPMLVVGLQPIHGQQIHLPRRAITFAPDRTLVLLYAGDKAGAWNAWYRRAIPEAARLYRDYLATTNQR